ncbi:MAG: GCN5-related N-acetyltransferase [Sphingomonas phyllosphaerae]
MRRYTAMADLPHFRAGRDARERRWLTLTRETLPHLARSRDWPVLADHCFQRILLDHACGGRWYDHISRRPAYAHAPDAVLDAAIALGEAVANDAVDLHALNARSLRWRGKTPR